MSYDLSRLRVLVLEDSPQMRDIFRTILASIGIKNVVQVADGIDAIVKLTTHAFDLAIVDWVVPRYDGIEFIEHVRKAPESPNPYLPIIMVTGHGERHKVMRARDAGATEFLVKPISAHVLAARIVEVIERPRPFVRTKNYFGPTRRRHRGEWSGTERREGYSSTGQNEKGAIEVIEPPNLIRMQVRGGGGVDPEAIRRAEAAVRNLKGAFEAAAEAQLEELQAACEQIVAGSSVRANLQQIARIAHELKGQGGTFGYELLSDVADLLSYHARRNEFLDQRGVQIVKTIIGALGIVIGQKIQGDGGPAGRELLAHLKHAIGVQAQG